ncbi:hypothetical protein Tco_1253626 [Tanacetum coccineum]
MKSNTLFGLLLQTEQTPSVVAAAPNAPYGGENHHEQTPPLRNPQPTAPLVVGGCDGGGVGVRLWWGGVVVVRRVEESDVVGRVDPEVGSIFGVGRISPPKKFSGGGDVVVAGMLAGEDGGWPAVGRPDMGGGRESFKGVLNSVK